MASNFVNFTRNPRDMQLIADIALRARRELWPNRGLTPIMMGIDAVHSNGCPLALAKLLAADRFNFIHDVGGISQHLNRQTGQLEGPFWPRYAISENHHEPETA